MATMRAKLVRKGGKYYILPAEEPGIVTPGTPKLRPQKRVIRPVTANPEILFHTVNLSDIVDSSGNFPRIYNFFTTYPNPNTLNGNYGEPYIKRTMIIQGIKIDYLPTSVVSHIDEATSTNTYDFRTAFNAFDRAFVKLLINKTTVFEYSLQDLSPDIRTDAELVNATGPIFRLYHKIYPSKFTPFKDLIGVESHYVTERDEVYVAIEFPSGLSITETSNNEVSGTLKVRVSLLTRPERRPYVG